MITKALNQVTETCLNKLDEIIQTNVYDGYHGNWEEAGMRTGQFLASWEKTMAKETVMNKIQTEIYQNLDTMITYPELLVHTDINGEDDRADIAQVLETGEGFNFGQREGQPAHYWSDFMVWVNANVSSLFKEALLTQGLEYTGEVGITETED